MYTCNKCNKHFSDEITLALHQIDDCDSKSCRQCKRKFSNASSLRRHRQANTNISCEHCDRVFCDADHYQQHLRTISRSVDENVVDLNQRIYPPSGYEDEDGYQHLVERKQKEIDDRFKKTRNYRIINKAIDSSYTYRELNELLLDIYSTHRNSYKLNLGFGFVLYNTHTNEYKYHYVSANNMLFERAVQISKKEDLTNLMKHIISLDLPTNYYLKKPSSSWILAGLTNIELFVFECEFIL